MSARWKSWLNRYREFRDSRGDRGNRRRMVDVTEGMLQSQGHRLARVHDENLTIAIADTHRGRAKGILEVRTHGQTALLMNDKNYIPFFNYYDTHFWLQQVSVPRGIFYNTYQACRVRLGHRAQIHLLDHAVGRRTSRNAFLLSSGLTGPPPA